MKTKEHYIVVGKPVYVNKEGSIKHAVEGLINGTSIWLAPVDDLQPETKELTASDIFRYKIYPGNVKKWTGKECDLYIFTIEQINELYAAQHKESEQKEVEVPAISDKDIRKYLLNKYKPIIHNNIDLNKHFRKCAFIEMKAMRDGKISQNQKQK
jgi:hypothetical protein